MNFFKVFLEISFENLSNISIHGCYANAYYAPQPSQQQIVFIHSFLFLSFFSRVHILSNVSWLQMKKKKLFPVIEVTTATTTNVKWFNFVVIYNVDQLCGSSIPDAMTKSNYTRTPPYGWVYIVYLYRKQHPKNFQQFSSIIWLVAEKDTPPLVLTMGEITKHTRQ